MSKKERLNLTVRDKFKQVAGKLAELRRRSVSGLFEDLVEEECNRVKEDDPEAAKILKVPSPRRKTVYPHEKRNRKRA